MRGYKRESVRICLQWVVVLQKIFGRSGGKVVSKKKHGGFLLNARQKDTTVTRSQT
jgi:hypothetical protein